MAPDYMIIIFTNHKKIPVEIPNPDPRYSNIVIDPGKTQAVECTEDWAQKVCLQIESLSWKKGGY
jgi:hypothetical protein